MSDDTLLPTFSPPSPSTIHMQTTSEDSDSTLSDSNLVTPPSPKGTLFVPTGRPIWTTDDSAKLQYSDQLQAVMPPLGCSEAFFIAPATRVTAAILKAYTADRSRHEVNREAIDRRIDQKIKSQETRHAAELDAWKTSLKNVQRDLKALEGKHTALEGEHMSLKSSHTVLLSAASATTAVPILVAAALKTFVGEVIETEAYDWTWRGRYFSDFPSDGRATPFVSTLRNRPYGNVLLRRAVVRKLVTTARDPNLWVHSEDDAADLLRGLFAADGIEATSGGSMARRQALQAAVLVLHAFDYRYGADEVRKQLERVRDGLTGFSFTADQVRLIASNFHVTL